jgi:hypothetical protein
MTDFLKKKTQNLMFHVENIQNSLVKYNIVKYKN